MKNSLKGGIMNNKYLDTYKNLLGKDGLGVTWDNILSDLAILDISTFESQYFPLGEIGDYYELGLAETNKIAKKDLGKYYTPLDVSALMADALINDYENTILEYSIVDIGCGCGNLVDAVLKRSNNFKNVYLYDLDPIAMKIAVSRIKKLYNVDPIIVVGDFLSNQTLLPKENYYAISNPPYALIKQLDNSWTGLDAFKESKDLYIGFFEKVILDNNAKRLVFITPQSFLTGEGFTKIREELLEHMNGDFYVFDNVPGNIFNGKKKGIFNTNNANSVRPAISVLDKNLETQMNKFRVSHMIRFKTEQRADALKYDYIKTTLGDTKQDLTEVFKCFKELEPFVYNVKKTSIDTVSSLLEMDSSKYNDQYRVSFSTSARYFTVATKKKLDRSGVFEFYAKDEDSFYKLYALLNSSYAYLWWRVLDGTIFVPKKLILNMRLPVGLTIVEDIKKFIDKMIVEENNYIHIKNNAGANQETVKFPESYRNTLNSYLFGDVEFKKIHQNFENVKSDLDSIENN
jgi:predicted RNA methylase